MSSFKPTPRKIHLPKTQCSFTWPKRNAAQTHLIKKIDLRRPGNSTHINSCLSTVFQPHRGLCFIDMSFLFMSQDGFPLITLALSKTVKGLSHRPCLPSWHIPTSDACKARRLFAVIDAGGEMGSSHQSAAGPAKQELVRAARRCLVPFSSCEVTSYRL